MDAIKVLRGCGASGKSLTAGTVYSVPAQVSQKDADLLIRLGKAEPATSKKRKQQPTAGADTNDADHGEH